MAKTGHGILDGFTGKLGTVIGGNWRGVSYMRAKPVRKKNRKQTDKQLEQQAKFKTAASFVQSMGDLLNEVLSDGETRKTRVNAAVAEALTGALIGVYPDFDLDYTQVMLCNGALPIAPEIAVAAIAKGVRYTWSPEVGLGKAAVTDKVVLVVYNPATKNSAYSVGTFTRNDAEAVLNIGYSGLELHTWIVFMTEDGRYKSSSHYCGKVTTS